MKKGCFITAIVVATIVIGAAMYIFQNHFDSLIMNPGKQWIADFVKNELEKELESVFDSPEKTELKRLIGDLSKDTDKLKKFNEKDVDRLINIIESAMFDSIIQKSELEEISQIIKSKSK